MNNEVAAVNAAARTNLRWRVPRVSVNGYYTRRTLRSTDKYLREFVCQKGSSCCDTNGVHKIAAVVSDSYAHLQLPHRPCYHYAECLNVDGSRSYQSPFQHTLNLDCFFPRPPRLKGGRRHRRKLDLKGNRSFRRAVAERLYDIRCNRSQYTCLAHLYFYSPSCSTAADLGKDVHSGRASLHGSSAVHAELHSCAFLDELALIVGQEGHVDREWRRPAVSCSRSAGHMQVAAARLPKR
eukprot:scaffold508_cov554-Prasinococcus_capsulatus_cf.AAC.10